MSPGPSGDASPAPRSEGSKGLVTLIVGEVGRSSSARRRTTKPVAGDGAEVGALPRVLQWSCQWSDGGPGPVVTGVQGEPSLTLSLSPGDAQLVLDGELAPSVAYMQGRLKTSGDNALLLEILRWTAGPRFAAALAAWASQPDLASCQAEPAGPQ